MFYRGGCMLFWGLFMFYIGRWMLFLFFFGFFVEVDGCCSGVCLYL